MKNSLLKILARKVPLQILFTFLTEHCENKCINTNYTKGGISLLASTGATVTNMIEISLKKAFTEYREVSKTTASHLYPSATIKKIQNKIKMVD